MFPLKGLFRFRFLNAEQMAQASHVNSVVNEGRRGVDWFSDVSGTDQFELTVHLEYLHLAREIDDVDSLTHKDRRTRKPLINFVLPTKKSRVGVSQPATASSGVSLFSGEATTVLRFDSIGSERL
jgi:hypothetical protein